MLTKYIVGAMRRAAYEILSDVSFHGEISGFQGIYSNAETLEACREQLQEVPEGWIILGLRLGHPMPAVDGIDLAVKVDDGTENTKQRYLSDLDTLLMNRVENPETEQQRISSEKLLSR